MMSGESEGVEEIMVYVEEEVGVGEDVRGG